MDFKKELKELQKNFEDALERYRSALKKFESADYVLENENMKKELAKINERLEQFAEENSKFRDENLNLKMSLNEQIIDERLSILKISKMKRDTFFHDASARLGNKLSALEAEINDAVKKFEETAKKELDTERNDALNEIRIFADTLIKKVTYHRKKLEEKEKKLVASIKEGYETLSSEPVTEETLQKRLKQNKVELKIGLNWINKIGIGLILIGVGYAARYSYVRWFTDTMRSITFFVLGGIFLGAGEYFYRKGKDIFAKGLLGGGISILYASVFISYFRYEIISLNIGLILMILVTLTAVVLSIRYDSQTIGGFALIGGYLPLGTYIHDIYAHDLAMSDPSLYGILGYLFILNLLMLLISFWRRWNIIMYMSFVLYISCFLYLIFDVKNFGAAIAYSIVAFSMYQAIVLLYPFRYRQKLKKADVIMLGLNTFISCIVIYILFERAELSWMRGILALIFALLYIGLGQIVQRIMKQEREILLLFYGTALTFAVLMIPFQFGIHWMTLGWLVEGLILTIVGYRQKIKYMEYAGWIITALCIVTFYFWDFSLFFTEPERVKYFKLKYASVIAGMIVIMVMYLRAIETEVISRFSKAGKAITVYKYFVVLSFWLFISITGLHYYDKLVIMLKERDPLLTLNSSFYRSIIAAILDISLAYALSKIKLIHDRVIQYFNVFLYLIAITICLSINASVPVLEPEYAQNTPLHYVALGILIAFNILIFIVGRELVLRILTRRKSNLELYPLTMGVYILGIVTAMVVVQFRLGDLNLVLSFCYLALAVGSIVYGFKRKYSYIRLFGLGVTFIALAKLFIWDLRFLEPRGKILAYFGFGASLLLISFIYQKIKHILDVPDAVIKK